MYTVEMIGNVRDDDGEHAHNEATSVLTNSHHDLADYYEKVACLSKLSVTINWVVKVIIYYSINFKDSILLLNGQLTCINLPSPTKRNTAYVHLAST